MGKKHPRPRKAHHGSYALALRGRITMYFAEATTWLGVAFWATVKPLPGIIQQTAAFIAKSVGAPMILPAIDSNHQAHNLFFTVNSVHSVKGVNT